MFVKHRLQYLGVGGADPNLQAVEVVGPGPEGHLVCSSGHEFSIELVTCSRLQSDDMLGEFEDFVGHLRHKILAFQNCIDAALGAPSTERTNVGKLPLRVVFGVLGGQDLSDELAQGGADEVLDVPLRALVIFRRCCSLPLIQVGKLLREFVPGICAAIFADTSLENQLGLFDLFLKFGEAQEQVAGCVLVRRDKAKQTQT
mmetsp:Transcript_157065/g.503940  ORF Transcript_157065/g.503940 Transcript_157065/m.503940 type:complete len:201 (+) Transcript_157065:2942-3544(+)